MVGNLCMVSPLPAPTTAAPPSLRMVAHKVEERLGPLLDEETARWGALDGSLTEPLGALRDLVLSDAKRIRPAFCYWGYVGAGGDADDPRVIDTGGALEFLQAFALVHDDVMDGSATRRGHRTAHLSFADDHRRKAWRGEPRRFGEGVAILIGDLAHVYADRLMAGCPEPARSVWDELRIELNVGQYLDLVGTARSDTDPTTARRIARYKSGRYTVERPLHLGAALTGQLDRLGPIYSAYGDPLGEAFQLRDDLLGAFGESDLTGKPVGDDLREGKPTALLAEATAGASPEQAGVLQRIGSPELSPIDISDVQQILIDTGARSRIENRIELLAEQAVAAVAGARLAGDASEALVQLAWYVARRDT